MGCKQSVERRENIILASTSVDDVTQQPHTVAGAGAASPQDQDMKFVLGGPTRPGHIAACFRGGFLFRIVNGSVWSFYNDTATLEMHVRVHFDAGSDITSLGSSQLINDDDDGLIVFAVIYPGETEGFCKGTYTSFSSDVAAKPLSSAYRERLNLIAEQEIQQVFDAVIQLAHGRTGIEDILASCVLQRVSFVDTSFPPGAVALSGEKNGKFPERRVVPLTGWCRPHTFVDHRGALSTSEGSSMNGPVGVFIVPVLPTDIEPGDLGDVSFLAAAAAVAEEPVPIHRLFSYPPGRDSVGERAIGAYRVTLCHSGWWTTYIVDDYLPCIAGQPCFARSRSTRGELWIGLLQKAYAKALGGYANILSCDVMHVLTDLTGFPSFRYDGRWPNHKTISYMSTLAPAERLSGQLVKPKRVSADMQLVVDASLDLYHQILAAVQTKHIVVLNTPATLTDATIALHKGASTLSQLESVYADSGLKLGQGYAVLGGKSFPALGLYLLRIRNAWSAAGGSGTWTGNWSDQSPAWSAYPAVAMECGFRAIDDGTFWMDWSDVQRFFDGGAQCCFTPQLVHDYRVKGSFDDGYPAVALEVSVEGAPVDAIVVVSQDADEAREKLSPETKYSAVMVAVCRPNPIKPTRLDVHRTSAEDPTRPPDGFSFIYGRDVSVMYRFEPLKQQYLVVPRAFDAGATRPFVLSFIADRVVDGATLRIRFVTISPRCKVFSNYATFEFGPSLQTPLEAEYQYRFAAKGIPSSTKGLELTSDLPAAPVGP